MGYARGFSSTTLTLIAHKEAPIVLCQRKTLYVGGSREGVRRVSSNFDLGQPLRPTIRNIARCPITFGPLRGQLGSLQDCSHGLLTQSTESIIWEADEYTGEYSVCPSVRLYVCLSVCMCVCVYVYVCLLLYYPPFPFSVCLRAYMYMWMCFSVRLFACLSVCLFVHLSQICSLRVAAPVGIGLLLKTK